MTYKELLKLDNATYDTLLGQARRFVQNDFTLRYSQVLPKWYSILPKGKDVTLMNEADRAKLNREVVVAQKLGESFYNHQDRLMMSWEFNALPPQELVIDSRTGVLMQKSSTKLFGTEEAE